MFFHGRGPDPRFRDLQATPTLACPVATAAARWPRVAQEPPPPYPTLLKKVTSPAPIALATSTSSVSSIVYEAKPSTSEGAMPASSRAARIARQARVFSDSGSRRANAVCPIPAIAVASLSVAIRQPPALPRLLTAAEATANLTDSQLVRRRQEGGRVMRDDEEWGTIPGLVRAAAERYGPAEAVAHGRTRLSYAGLGARVERAAAACLAAGVEPGDRVAIWAPNTPDWIVSALGAVSAGAVLVPLNTRFKGTEAAHILRRSRARLLFVTGTFLGTSYVASLRRAEVKLPDLERVVVLADTAPEDYTSWPEFLAAGERVPAGAVRERADAVRPSDPSDIIYTSGTTGAPRVR